MGQRYNQQQSSNSIQKATFLPMLCSRPSIKNVTIPKSLDYSSSSCSSPLSQLQEDHHHHDPLSPKISCIGQVKRHNKIIGFPTTNHNHSHNKLAMVTTNNHSQYYTTYHTIPYFKLKRFFSSKTLTTTTTSTMTKVTPTKTDNTSTSSNSNSSGRKTRRRERGELEKKGQLEKGSSKVDEGSEKGVVINVVDLDPPLPVIKKKQEGSEKTENLWKRRSGGLELGSLQLQRVRPNLRHHQIMQLTTV